jgi:hypothetical protein
VSASALMHYVHEDMFNQCTISAKIVTNMVNSSRDELSVSSRAKKT